jgi:RNA polymerase sigma-70 factor (ECF subfamily)
MDGRSERREMFSRLIEQHGVALRRLAGAYLSNPAAREDLFQEIALAVWSGLPGFRGEASERTWLYRIAHNTASTQLHKLRQRRERERQPDDCDHEPAGTATPESEFDDNDRRARFFDALRQLPTLDFQIVTMHLEGLPYAEIADVTGMTQTNVGARLSRIRKALASQLGPLEAKP